MSMEPPFTEKQILDRMDADSDEVKKERVRVASEQVIKKHAAQRYAAAFVFAVMLIVQLVADIALQNTSYATLDTSNLGDLLYIAGLLYSFWKAVG